MGFFCRLWFSIFSQHKPWLEPAATTCLAISNSASLWSGVTCSSTIPCPSTRWVFLISAWYFCVVGLQVFLWLTASPLLSGSGDPLHSGRHPVLHSHQASWAGGGQEPAGTEAVGCFTCCSTAGILVTGCPMCWAPAHKSFLYKVSFLHYDYFCRRISSCKGLYKKVKQTKKNLNPIIHVGTCKGHKFITPADGLRSELFSPVEQKEQKSTSRYYKCKCLFVLNVTSQNSEWFCWSLSVCGPTASKSVVTAN